MAALPPVITSFASKAVIRFKRDYSAAEEADMASLGTRRDGRIALQPGPTDGAMAYVKSEFEVRCSFHFFAWRLD